MQRMNQLESTVAGLIIYSMEDADWDFEQLTEMEKEIVGNQERLDSIKLWVEEKAGVVL